MIVSMLERAKGKSSIYKSCLRRGDRMIVSMLERAKGESSIYKSCSSEASV